MKGFTTVFELLREAKKPIVGHNLFFDILFFFSHFHSKLPDDYLVFKKRLNKYFPTIYDTKYLAE
jgi:poly(A)-specific ribonuclease